MKKFVFHIVGLMLLAVFMVASGVMAEIIPVNVSLNSSDVIIEQITVGDITYSKIGFTPNIKNGGDNVLFWSSDSIGLPQLPCFEVRAVIPFNHTVVEIANILCIPTYSFDLEGYYIYPSQTLEPTRDLYVRKDFQHVNIEFWNLISETPDTINVDLVNVGTLHNQTFATILIAPFKYTPSTGEFFLVDVGFNIITEPSLSVPQITTEIVWPSYLPYPANQIPVENPEDVAGFCPELSFIEPTVERSWYYELVIIPDTSYLDVANQLRLWRTGTHRPTKVLTLTQVEEMFSGDYDFPEAIRQCVKHYYDMYGVQSMMLVAPGGDRTIRHLFWRNTNEFPDIIHLQIGNCLYYGELSRTYEDWDTDGDGVFGERNHDNPDFWNEVIVGILPAQSPEEFQIYVDKLIDYEQNGSGGQEAYVVTAIDQLVAYGQHITTPVYIPDYVYVDNFSCIEIPSGGHLNPWLPFGAGILDLYEFNYVKYVNEFSHGGIHRNTGKTPGWNEYQDPNIKSYVSTIYEDSFYNPGYIGDLTGSGNKMVMWTSSCQVGNYEAKYYDSYQQDKRCMGEGYTFVPNGGTIVYIGHSRDAWCSLGDDIPRIYWDILFNPGNNEYIAGRGFRLAKMFYTGGLYWEEQYGLLLYGSPSIAILNNVPREFSITGVEDNISLGQHIVFDYIVTDLDGSSVAGATAVVQQGERYELGRIVRPGIIVDASGNPMEWDIESTDPVVITISAWATPSESFSRPQGYDITTHNYLVAQKIVPVDNTSERNFLGKNADNDGIVLSDLASDFSSVGSEVYAILTDLGHDVVYMDSLPQDPPELLILCSGVSGGDYLSEERLNRIRYLANHEQVDFWVFGIKNLIFLPYTEYFGIDVLTWDSQLADSAWGINALDGLNFSYVERFATSAIGSPEHGLPASVIMVNNNGGSLTGSRGVLYDYPLRRVLTWSFDFAVVDEEAIKSCLIGRGLQLFGYPVFVEDGNGLPVEFGLFQNYPNPFNSSTVISYGLFEADHVNLAIYNLLGQKVMSLVNEIQEPGSYSVVWDASEEASGIYFCKLVTENNTIVKKMTLQK
jgi:hypothetical protein